MQLDDERVIYISLGSTPLNNHPDFFNVCFEAFAKMDRRVVVATGETDPTSLGQAPSNFILRSYVPQIEILQHADVFITHGGMNSTLESLWYGVPLIVCAYQPETTMTASRITELELGTALDPHTLNAKVLRHTVESVLINTAYQTNIKNVQALLRDSGGYQEAANAIEHLVTERLTVQ